MECLERVKPIKQPLGQGAEPAPIQQEMPQARQTPEDVPGQAGDGVPVQKQLLQAAQPIEQAGGQGPQRSALIRSALPRSAQIQERQRRQPFEVPDPEVAEVALILQVQHGDRVQQGRGDILAGTHAGDRRHDGIAHAGGTATDAGILDLDGKDETGGVGINVSGRPGVRAP